MITLFFYANFLIPIKKVFIQIYTMTNEYTTLTLRLDDR
ncbi:MAG: hypothetical protein UV63_C0031G0010 [Microgenomates group bacterium GW2011_GWC1_43_11]|nr:MAG: hypothetical protein UV63_C0031G0010 [Microgenomates group bacterium GW2011_GWC1_43_11]